MHKHFQFTDLEVVHVMFHPLTVTPPSGITSDMLLFTKETAILCPGRASLKRLSTSCMD